MTNEAPATVIDPDGRLVVLTAERWTHILRGHPELSPFRGEILDTVAMPTRHLLGPTIGEHWF